MRLDGLCVDPTDYKRKTIDKIRSILKQLFELAKRYRYVTYDPTDGLTIKREASPKVQALTEREQEVLCEAIVSLPCRLSLHYGLAKTDNFIKTFSVAILTCLYTGLRRGELFALEIDDIDMANNNLKITKQVQYPDNNRGILVDGTKTEAGVRVVPVPQKLASVLYPFVESKRKLGHTLLFCKDNGELYAYSDIKRRWETPSLPLSRNRFTPRRTFRVF